MENIIIYHKNARGLSKDDRVEELMEELEGLEWNVIMVNETMRSQKREFWTTRGGHIFLASGYDLPTRGVAIVLHKKWSKYIKQFTPINERCAFVDIRSKKMKIRFVSAYFPHSWYSDTEVQELYDILTETVREAKQKRLKAVMGADCNAEVGTPTENDDQRSVGNFGVKTSNPRGQWLKAWATSNNMFLANTCFEKPVEKLMTFVGPSGNPRQIDYFLVSRRLRGWTKDCESVPELDFGADRKTLKLRMVSNNKTTTKKNRRRNRQGGSLWPPVSMDEYRSKLTQNLQSISSEVECEQIENTIRKNSHRYR